jgi:hypothetical protein
MYRLANLVDRRWLIFPAVMTSVRSALLETSLLACQPEQCDLPAFVPIYTKWFSGGIPNTILYFTSNLIQVSMRRGLGRTSALFIVCFIYSRLSNFSAIRRVFCPFHFKYTSLNSSTRSFSAESSILRSQQDSQESTHFFSAASHSDSIIRDASSPRLALNNASLATVRDLSHAYIYTTILKLWTRNYGL